MSRTVRTNLSSDSTSAREVGPSHSEFVNNDTIPENWQRKRADWILREERQTVDPSELEAGEVFHYSIPVLQEKGDGELQPPSEIGSKKIRIQGPTLLVSRLNPHKGVVALANHQGVPTLASSEFVALRAKDCNLRFAYYLYSSELVRQRLDAEVQSATRSHKRAKPADITKMWHPVPPTPVQHSIAKFLDRRTLKIDRLIDKKERLIKLLEERRTALITKAVTKGLDPDVSMKDSGVEWLGEIPEHWKVSKLKMTAEIQTGLTIGQNYSGPTEERPYLRVANVQDGYLDLSEITTVEVPQSEIKKTELQSGDVLMTEGGDFDKLGRGYVWEGQIEGCLHQNHIFAIRPNQEYLSPRFLSYVTTSLYGRTYFSATAKQSTNLASTNRTKVGNFPLPLPPQEEQAHIVAALEQRESVTEQLKDLIQQAVSYLQKYRSALITAAVTGKIDVRDHAA